MSGKLLCENKQNSPSLEIEANIPSLWINFYAKTADHLICYAAF